MELNQQLAGVQDEVKLLKGEIKTILKELRTAVLSRDNPFSAEASSPPVFRPVGRDDAAEPESAAGGPALEEPAPPFPNAAGEPAPPPHAPPPPQPALRLVEPEAPREEQSPAPKQAWNPLTVASLAAWAEEALTELGPRRFQIVLELSRLAGLLSTEVKDVLAGMSQFAPEQANDDRPIHINNCVVVLHQLEAILRGEQVSKLPRRRRLRRGRAR